MKPSFVLYIGLIVSLMPATGYAQTNANDNCDLQQLVIRYGEAVNSLTASSLKFGADTETAWAIDTINTIWTNCKAKPFDQILYMGDIAVMQAYFAYGVTYLPMTYYSSKYYEEIKAGKETYRTDFDEDMRKVHEQYPNVVRYKNDFSYFLIHAYSLDILELYFAMMDDLQGNDIRAKFAAMHGLDFIGKLYVNKDIAPINYAWPLDGTSFYIAYHQWIIRTAQNPDNEQRQAKLIEYAKIFDGYASPIRQAMVEGKPLPPVTHADAKAYLCRTLPIRIDMLQMLEENFKQVK